MQSLHLQRTEQRLYAGVVPAVALATHRAGDIVIAEHVPKGVAGVLRASVAAEQQAGLFAGMALELRHA